MGGVDKLFVPLLHKPLLAWCVDVLEASWTISTIVIAVAGDSLAEAGEMALQREWRKTRLVEGGASRQDSVRNALAVTQEVDWILVHDGDRPFLNDDLIERGLKSVRETGATVAGVPLKDTVKVVENGDVVRTLNRGDLRAIQTPQVFRAETLRSAHTVAGVVATDDATLVEALGLTVRVYDGSYENLKVTTIDDLILARAIASQMGVCE